MSTCAGHSVGYSTGAMLGKDDVLALSKIGVMGAQRNITHFAESDESYRIFLPEDANAHRKAHLYHLVSIGV